MSRNISSPSFLRTRAKESGRLYEIPLLFVGSTMVFVLLFPRAVQSEHRGLAWLVLEGYVAILLFLFWILRGWGRMAATVFVNLGAVAWHWIPADFRLPLMISASVLFLAGWAFDFWFARRGSSSSTPGQ